MGDSVGTEEEVSHQSGGGAFTQGAPDTVYIPIAGIWWRVLNRQTKEVNYRSGQVRVTSLQGMINYCSMLPAMKDYPFDELNFDPKVPTVPVTYDQVKQNIKQGPRYVSSVTSQGVLPSQQTRTPSKTWIAEIFRANKQQAEQAEDRALANLNKVRQTIFLNFKSFLFLLHRITFANS